MNTFSVEQSEMFFDSRAQLIKLQLYGKAAWTAASRGVTRSAKRPALNGAGWFAVATNEWHITANQNGWP